MSKNETLKINCDKIDEIATYMDACINGMDECLNKIIQNLKPIIEESNSNFEGVVATKVSGDIKHFLYNSYSKNGDYTEFKGALLTSTTFLRNASQKYHDADVNVKTKIN